MRVFLQLASALSLLALSQVLPPAEAKHLAPRTCTDASQSVLWTRWWSPGWKAHLYWVSGPFMAEVTLGITDTVYHGPAARVFPNKTADTVPLYRFFSDAEKTYMFLAGAEEEGAPPPTPPPGFVPNGVYAWVYPTQICGSVPFYVLYSSALGDYFYTTDASEHDVMISWTKGTYADKGIVGYVLPDSSSCVCRL